MKLRHATALGLIGWYLMIPPRGASEPNAFDDHAPLSRWFVFSSHDAAHECEGAKFLNREGHKQHDDPMRAMSWSKHSASPATIRASGNDVLTRRAHSEGGGDFRDYWRLRSCRISFNTPRS